jgi:hypothetical protein
MPGATPPIYVVGRTADLERDVAEHLGIALEVRGVAEIERWLAG